MMKQKLRWDNKKRFDFSVDAMFDQERNSLKMNAKEVNFHVDCTAILQFVDDVVCMLHVSCGRSVIIMMDAFRLTFTFIRQPSERLLHELFQAPHSFPPTPFQLSQLVCASSLKQSLTFESFDPVQFESCN